MKIIAEVQTLKKQKNETKSWFFEKIRLINLWPEKCKKRQGPYNKNQK